MSSKTLLTTFSKRLFSSSLSPSPTSWSLQKGRLSLSKLQDKVLLDESIDSVNLVFPDQYGRLTGLKLNAEYFLEQMKHQSTPVYFELKQNPFRFDSLGKAIDFFPDTVTLPKSLLLAPDIGTLREMSWQKKEAMVMAEVHDPEEPKLILPYSPRQILKRAVAERVVGVG